MSMRFLCYRDSLVKKKKKEREQRLFNNVKKNFGLTLCYYDNGKTTNQHYFRLPQHNTSAQ